MRTKVAQIGSTGTASRWWSPFRLNAREQSPEPREKKEGLIRDRIWRVKTIIIRGYSPNVPGKKLKNRSGKLPKGDSILVD